MFRSCFIAVGIALAAPFHLAAAQEPFSGPDGTVQAMSLGLFGDVSSLHRKNAGGRGRSGR